MAEPAAPLSPAALRLAGHVGQIALDRAAAAGGGVVAELDQHVAAVRAELRACQRPSAVERPDPGSHSGDAPTRRGTPQPAHPPCPDVPFADSARYAEPTVPRELLLHYASGFVRAALSDGWQPAASADAGDWVSLRLAAVCQLISQSEAASRPHPDLPASA